jgi:hypothetical protein
MSRALRSFWLICCDCQHEWPSDFSSEYGCLFAAYRSGEECPECESDDIEIQGEADSEGDDE